MFLDDWADAAVVAFALTIATGLCFHYASAKWVKRAWGQPVLILGERLEFVLDLAFWLTVASYVGGLVLFGIFVLQAGTPCHCAS